MVDGPDAHEGVVSFIERRAPKFVTTGITAVDNPSDVREALASEPLNRQATP
jgi:hypothetical protein